MSGEFALNALLAIAFTIVGLALLLGLGIAVELLVSWMMSGEDEW